MIGPSFVGLRCPGPCLARQWHPWRRPHRWPRRHRWPRSHRWPQSHRRVRRLPLEARPPWSRPQAGMRPWPSLRSRRFSLSVSGQRCWRVTRSLHNWCLPVPPKARSAKRSAPDSDAATSRSTWSPQMHEPAQAVEVQLLADRSGTCSIGTLVRR